MRIPFLLLITLSILSLPVYGQQPVASDHAALRSLLRPVPGLPATAGVVKGSPLMFEDWQSGEITLADQAGFASTVLVNPDLLNNVLRVRLGDGTTGVLPLSATSGLVLRSGRERIFRTRSPETGQEGLFEYLASGTYPLVKHWRKYLVGTGPDQRFQVKTIYMLQTSGGQWHSLDLAQDSLEALLPEARAAIRGFLEKNPSGVFNETTLVRILNHLDHF